VEVRGVELSSGVGVRLSVRVGTDGTVALGSGVRGTGTFVEVTAGARNWLASGSPRTAEATVEESRTSASASHCQPASMCALRVR